MPERSEIPSATRIKTISHTECTSRSAEVIDVDDDSAKRLESLEKRVWFLEDLRINYLENMIAGPPEDPGDPEELKKNLRVKSTR